MENNSVRNMIESERLKLPFWRTLEHYFFVSFFLFIPSLTTFDIIQYYFFDSNDGIRHPEELAIDYLWLVPAIIIAIIQWNRLRFTKYKISANEAEIIQALNLTAKELRWKIIQRSDNFIRASRHWSFEVGWGETISILPMERSVLINSISSTVSFGMNKTNTRTFMINLYNVVNGTSILNPEERANKWSVGNTIFRVLAYPFCIGLLLFATFSMFPNGEIILGVSCIVIAAYYFYTDLV